jgi:RNA polymerase-binding transcription factor DksA
MSIQPHFIDEIRGRLRSRRIELLTREQRVGTDLARRNDPLVADSSDQAIQVQNDETLQAIGEAAQNELTEIDEALERLATGAYGICKQCGDHIPDERLLAVPSATTCAGCAGALQREDEPVGGR